MSKPAVCSSLGSVATSVARMTTLITVTVVITIANSSIAVPVRKRLLSG